MPTSLLRPSRCAAIAFLGIWPLAHAAPQSAAAASAPAPAASAAAAVPPRSADAILRQALDDAGKIDKELRKDMSNQIEAPVDKRLSKLATGIEAASAKPKPWEAPKIENVADQGGYDRRIYKVTTSAGVYCIYNESNHAPDGLDSMKNGLHPKIMTCPREK